MPISDVYTARSGSVAVAASTATAVMSLIAPATKRAWIVGIRVELGVTAAAAGSNTLIQLCRPSATNTATSLTTVPAHDFSAPNSLSSQATTWSTAPTVGTVLAEYMLPLTTGSMWEEFPPPGYEWQVPAIATGAANSGLHVIVTQNVATSSPYYVDLIFSE